ncbi:gliding motility lipoprotein GldB [Aquimarina hainanensis]|uniref:Gliding motility lipoprotein GldB n=1 Tax=Aquimarina hainanensis TaxID=1578017 RepID=A0ABW5N782_9FLAO|nr:gliding motility lipoprotein GldB [Aquimarina sp. TRL1]
MCLLYVAMISCNKNKGVEEDIAKVDVTIEVERFDELFAAVTSENLNELKERFPFLFPERYENDVWLKKSVDTLQVEINTEVSKKFSDFSTVKNELHSFFQHVKFYFPEERIPRIVTVTSDVDYRNKVILHEGLLIISLDTYLGKDHFFYENISVYLKQGFVTEQIVPDVASMYAKKMIRLSKDRTFLSNMIYYGKEQYLKKLFLPVHSKASLLGYTEEQYAWSEANEEEIWKYFIDRQLLYSTDTSLLSRFLFPAPFSKFYLEEIDKEAPGKIGQFIGERIVSSYMENNDVSLHHLLMVDAETVFKKSKYKPVR